MGSGGGGSGPGGGNAAAASGMGDAAIAAADASADFGGGMLGGLMGGLASIGATGTDAPVGDQAGPDELSPVFSRIKKASDNTKAVDGTTKEKKIDKATGLAKPKAVPLFSPRVTLDDWWVHPSFR